MVGRIEIFAQQNFTHIVLFLAIFVDFNELLPDFSDLLENAEQVERHNFLRFLCFKLTETLTSN